MRWEQKKMWDTFRNSRITSYFVDSAFNGKLVSQKYNCRAILYTHAHTHRANKATVVYIHSRLDSKEGWSNNSISFTE